MANKYTAFPAPRKERLEKMYHQQFMSQIEIGEKFGVSQKMVFGWFKRLGIKSRKAFKRNQSGKLNSSWKGKNATYAALHYRVISAKGRPKKCEICGTEDENKYYDWACVGDYTKISDYKRMCRSCHWKHDKTHLNFVGKELCPSKLIPKRATS